MRLLPERDDHDDESLTGAERPPIRRRSSGGAEVQSLPMRCPSRNSAGGDEGCLRNGKVGVVMPNVGIPPSTAAAGPEGTLSVVRRSSRGTTENFLVLTSDGSITAFSGHVDLGTGIRTALAQIVAEELDVAFERVTMVLGDTARVPNQGPTIASETIQIAAVPIRNAAAQARQFLVARAAERFDVHLDELSVEDGLVRCSGNRGASYGELIAGQTFTIELADNVAVKSFESYKIVGKRAPRVDIAAKATGELTYVHDIRVPGMVHGRVVRPPY